MKRNACGPGAFSFAYSFKKLFKPHFNSGVNAETVRSFVADKNQTTRVEAHLALTSSVYTKKGCKDPSFIAAVRQGETGC